MASASEIRQHLSRLLSGQVSLDDFENWFVPYSWNIHKHGDEEAQQVAYAVEHQLSRFDEDCDELRQALLGILDSSGIYSGKNRFGEPLATWVAESNAPSDFIRAAA